MHDFKTSLAKGKQGEALLLEAMPELVPLNGRKSDFINPATEELYELKSDQYDMSATKNFFIEIYSDVERKAVGGPWQAAEHGSQYWMYMFPKNRVLFIFKTVDLLNYLEYISTSVYETSRIYNRSWTTLGMKVPREDLKHLYVRIDF